MAKRGTSGIDDAVRAAGGLGQLGRAIGCSVTAVCRWRQAGRVPANRVLAIEAATGIPRDRLRPDLYARNATPGMAELQAPFNSETQRLGLDPQAIAEAAVRKAVGEEKARRWAEGSRAAIDAHNAWVEEHGLPLAHLRLF